MYSLLLDSSNTKLGVGIAKDDILLDKIYYDAWQRQSEFMIQEINNILSRNKILPSQINEIIVTDGPGSYTGVRISLTIAKVVGVLNENVKIYLLSSLEILKDKNNLSICLMNARSNRSYVGIYKDNEVILNDCVLENQNIEKLIDKYTNISICGETEYLGLKSCKYDIFNNMLDIKKHKDPVKDVLKIKAVYLKDWNARN